MHDVTCDTLRWHPMKEERHTAPRTPPDCRDWVDVLGFRFSVGLKEEVLFCRSIVQIKNCRVDKNPGESRLDFRPLPFLGSRAHSGH